MISKRRELSHQDAKRNKLKSLYTPSHKMNSSLRPQDRTLNPDRSGGAESISRERQTLGHPLRDHNDVISRKYKETYGVSLISKSKER